MFFAVAHSFEQLHHSRLRNISPENTIHSRLHFNILPDVHQDKDLKLLSKDEPSIVMQSQDILLRKDPDKISSCKRVIQNLKVTDDSGKLVNRTLITLVNNAVTSCP